MAKYQLKVLNPSIHGVTGHHTIEVIVVETADNGSTIEGVPEKYGIDSMVLRDVYAGDVKKWLQVVGQEMLEKHQQRQAAHLDLLALDGQSIDLK
jgi:hypothetical protein